MADDPYAVRSTIGLLGWRVELRPRTPSRIVEFLHVMQVGTAGQSPDAAVGASQQLTAEAATVAVEQAGTRFVLSLNRIGPRGGTIAVLGSGPEIRDALPETVEDHWRHFQDDPHFRLWQTDPRYRLVIGEMADAANAADTADRVEGGLKH